VASGDQTEARNSNSRIDHVPALRSDGGRAVRAIVPCPWGRTSGRVIGRRRRLTRTGLVGRPRAEGSVARPAR
jgi:hypothetical protein